MMTFSKLLIRNLFYHWRGNLAVLLGITLGSAVLTGALLVGDSLRGSLKALTLDQLGWIDEALVPGRFFREQLAKDVSAERAAPALLLQGSISHSDADGESERIGKVTVFGIDGSFWPKEQIPEGAEFWASEDRAVVLNRALADTLKAKAGDNVTLHLQRADNVPRETLLGKRKAEDVIESFTVKVRQIMADDGMARFSLKPSPEAARNAFVPMRLLQKRFDLAGRANAIFVAQPKSTLQADLHKQLALDDWGLRLRSPQDRAAALIKFLDPNNSDGNLKRARWLGRVPEALAESAQANGGVLTLAMVQKYYLSHRNYNLLESRRMILEPVVVQAAEKIGLTRPMSWEATPIVISLADSIGNGKIDVPYAIVAGVDTQRMFNVALADDEMVLVDWPGSPLKTKVGQCLTITYFSPDQKNHLEKRSKKFKVKLVPKLEAALDDPDLTPEFPGITDKLDMANWDNPPFPYDPKRVKKADEDFWKRYRTTPRAYVNLKIAKELWGTRFGDVTSLRFTQDAKHSFASDILAELKPEQGGFVFQNLREQGLNASAGATDFGVLFLAFSFFLILSALLLVGLLVRLNLDRRAGEIGLLLATGWSHGQVRRLLLGEGAILTVAGGLAGLGCAVLYADLMLKFLAANWPGGSSLNFLSLHAESVSYAIGFVGSLGVSLLTLFWATRVLGNLSPRSLIAGETTQTSGLANAKSGWSMALIVIGVIGALALAVSARFLPAHEAQAGCFFGSGALFLMACLTGIWNGMKRSGRASSPQPTLGLLGMRNAGRHAVRSVLTVGLLAAASFLIVAVESFHKDTDQQFTEKTGGSGGFALYAEGNVPVFEDLNQVKVRSNRGLDTPEMRTVKFFPCRVQPGDDASCLNLYKPLKPRVMGVSEALVQRGGFSFAASLAQTAEEKKNPWLLLQGKTDAAIPAIIDANTAQWILKTSLGETIEVNDDQGGAVKLRIVALLQESIFQSEVLVGAANFLTLYPRQEGFSFLLVDTGAADADTIPVIEKQIAEALAESGMDVATTASRLQGYLAIENMYLATFQALGGLGLILGAAGLAIVLLRGVWERRAELALLQALGFRSAQLAWLVLAENGFLLVLGLAAGTVSALLAVAPHLIGAGAQVLWLRIAVLLILVLVVGLLAAALAVWSTVRTPVLTALRRE